MVYALTLTRGTRGCCVQSSRWCGAPLVRFCFEAMRKRDCRASALLLGSGAVTRIGRVGLACAPIARIVSHLGNPTFARTLTATLFQPDACFVFKKKGLDHKKPNRNCLILRVSDGAFEAYFGNCCQLLAESAPHLPISGASYAFCCQLIGALSFLVYA